MRHTKIGHTLLTWDAFAHPENIERGIRDIAGLGFAGTETGGSLYDWWEQRRPGQLGRILRDSGIPMVTLFHSGDWTAPDGERRLLEDARRWSTAIAGLGGEMLMLVPGRRRDTPPYGLNDFKRMAETMNHAGQIAHDAGIDASMHPHWGTAAETRLEIELLLSLLDPALVGFAPDTGQIAKGGADPVPLIARWADRIRYVHLKDLSATWEEQRAAGVPLRGPEGYAELGQGGIDFPRLLDPIILIAARAVVYLRPQRFADGARVGVVPVRRHPPRGVPGEVACLAEEPLRGAHVARLAAPRVDQIALPIDRAVQVAPGTIDLDVGLVRMPLGTRCAAPFGAQLGRQQRGEARLPVADGLMAEGEDPREEHLGQVA